MAYEENIMAGTGQTNPTPTFKSLEHDGYHAQAATYGDRPGRLTRQAIAPMLEAVGAALACACSTFAAGLDTTPVKPVEVNESPFLWMVHSCNSTLQPL